MDLSRATPQEIEKRLIDIWDVEEMSIISEIGAWQGTTPEERLGAHKCLCRVMNVIVNEIEGAKK